HTDPRNHRIGGGKNFPGGQLQRLAGMQNAPQPIEFAPVCGPDRIEQVVEYNHRNAEHGDKRGWQKNQPGQNNHRTADGPDDLTYSDVVINIQEPAETDDRDLQQDKPKAAAQEEP